MLGLSETRIRSEKQARQLLEDGRAARVTAANAIHDQSSRSHAALQLVLRDRDGDVLVSTPTACFWLLLLLAGAAYQCFCWRRWCRWS